jgi:hypothetical protein
VCGKSRQTAHPPTPVQGLAGVTVSLLNIATLSVGNDSSFSALLFFSLAVAVIAVCIGARVVWVAGWVGEFAAALSILLRALWPSQPPAGFYVLLHSPLIKSCLQNSGGLTRQNTVRAHTHTHTHSLSLSLSLSLCSWFSGTAQSLLPSWFPLTRRR